MNSQVQLLQKRVRKLEEVNRALRSLVQVLASDLEMTESVGAAFAFDLASWVEARKPCSTTHELMLRELQDRWDTALSALDAEAP